MIVPDDRELPAFEAGLNSDSLGELLAGMTRQTGALAFPKWKSEGPTIALKDALTALGMGVAFSDMADFSRMTDAPVQIDDVYHKAFIVVDEKGTEAAAAIGVTTRVVSAPGVNFDVRLDRPFVYLIRDIATNTILFMGRMTD